MFKKNNFLLGIVTGAVLPVVTWVVFNQWHKELVLLNKPLIPYFATILINLVLIRQFHQSGAEKTTRGIMLSTFVFLIFIFLLKIKI